MSTWDGARRSGGARRPRVVWPPAPRRVSFRRAGSVFVLVRTGGRHMGDA